MAWLKSRQKELSGRNFTDDEIIAALQHEELLQRMHMIAWPKIDYIHKEANAVEIIKAVVFQFVKNEVKDQ